METSRPFSPLREHMYYVLDEDNVAVPVRDVNQWGAMFEATSQRRVGESFVFGTRVSTVFLGLNHAFGGGPPLLFESMAFSYRASEELQTRCSTWAQAELQHEAMVAEVWWHYARHPWLVFHDLWCWTRLLLSAPRRRREYIAWRAKRDAERAAAEEPKP